jgi:hypothetical protein
MKMLTTEACALCSGVSPLKRSHIIPEFLYSSIYDQRQHRFMMVSLRPEDDKRLFQKGLREPLLCAHCETTFSRWEGYAKKVLRGEVKLETKHCSDHVAIQGIDYRFFKLFLLSVLWRLGRSTRPEFSSIQLGPHLGRLHALLLAGDPGKPADYPCVMTTLRPDDHALLARTGMLPHATRFEGHRSVLFLTGLLQWIFIVSRHSREFPYRETFLQPDGSLKLLKGTEELSRSVIASFSSIMQKPNSEARRGKKA